MGIGVSLSLNWSTIDANGDFKLDPNELLYFDVNKNGVLDTNEEAAIYAVQELLAPKLLQDIDDDENGEVDQNEFFAMAGSSDLAGFHSFKNVAAKSDAERLEIFLRDRLKETLVPWQGSARVYVPPPPTFKERVEAFWAKQKSTETAKKP